MVHTIGRELTDLTVLTAPLQSPEDLGGCARLKKQNKAKQNKQTKINNKNNNNNNDDDDDDDDDNKMIMITIK